MSVELSTEYCLPWKKKKVDSGFWVKQDNRVLSSCCHVWKWVWVTVSGTLSFTMNYSRIKKYLLINAWLYLSLSNFIANIHADNHFYYPILSCILAGLNAGEISVYEHGILVAHSAHKETSSVSYQVSIRFQTCFLIHTFKLSSMV